MNHRAREHVQKGLEGLHEDTEAGERVSSLACWESHTGERNPGPLSISWRGSYPVCSATLGGSHVCLDMKTYHRFLKKEFKRAFEWDVGMMCFSREF